MALRLLATVVFCAFLSSCAYQGVIVDKSSREMPFSVSNGIGGSFAFMLKDSTGTVHRQLVTPEVFALYEVGEYFNDMQPAPARSQRPSDGKTMVSDGKTMLSARNMKRSSSGQVASTHKPNRARPVASKATSKTGKKVASKNSRKSRKTHRAVAAKKSTSRHARSASAKPAPKIEAQPEPATPAFATKPSDVDIVDIGSIPKVR